MFLSGQTKKITQGYRFWFLSNSHFLQRIAGVGGLCSSMFAGPRLFEHINAGQAIHSREWQVAEGHVRPSESHEGRHPLVPQQPERRGASALPPAWNLRDRPPHPAQRKTKNRKLLFDLTSLKAYQLLLGSFGSWCIPSCNRSLNRCSLFSLLDCF